MVAKKGSRPAGGHSRSLRTLQHQTLSPKVRYAIDTEVWLRALLLARQPRAGLDPRWATKDQVHDEALAWFLHQQAQQPVKDYPARRDGDEDLTFWIDSKIMERARRMAQREGVKVARLIDAAFNAYVRHHIPEQLLDFRQRVQNEAMKLYGSLRGATLLPVRTRKSGP